FDFLARLGIEPHERAGGGHIHMGNDIFVKKPRLFRNFFIDYSNRPELAYGVLGNHQGNGPSFAMIPEAQRRAFGMELRKFDSSREKDQTADRFIKLVHQTAYKKHPFPELFGGRFGTAPTYYQAIRFQTYLP